MGRREERTDQSRQGVAEAAAARKNLLLYFVLASLHQLAPVCWWVPFNVELRVEIKFHGENSTADWRARVAAETSH